MLLTLVVILILIGSAVVGSLYSNFLVFYENFTETENYHKARYASVAAIERAELVIKQRQPGFEGSGGRILSEDQPGSLSDQKPEGTGFSYLSKANHSPSTLYRSIKSKTDRIPSNGEGNVEKLLAADDSTDYNMMDYENAEIFMLYYDNGSGRPYDKKTEADRNQADLQSITVGIRLPPYIRPTLKNLDDDHSLMPGGYRDDALVDWQLRGKYNNNDFTIFATQNAAGTDASSSDSSIRESDLNQETGMNLTFGKNYRNPKIKKHNDNLTIISSNDAGIKNLTGTNGRYYTIFHDIQFSDLQLRLSLLNLVLGEGSLGKRYPFLEYYAEFGNTVSDKYYTIQTQGNFGDYQIDTVIYKPTITESILKSFTTIL